MSKRALGKGLSALIQEGDSASPTSDLTLSIPVDRISAGKSQPRNTFDEESLAELAESIRMKGILQPIIVQKSGAGYAIVAGERRFRAAKLAGMHEIPAIVRSYSDEEKLQISLIENIQRENLNPIEEAAAYREILKRSSLNQEELAKVIGKKRATIANSLRLLKLPADMRNALEEKTITPGHARAILSVDAVEGQKALFEQVLRGGISVRATEAAADAINSGAKKGALEPKKKETKAQELRDVQQKLIEVLGTKVQVKGSLQKGTIEISFFSLEDLMRIYDLMAEE